MTQPVNQWEVVLLLRGLESAYNRCAEAHWSDGLRGSARKTIADHEEDHQCDQADGELMPDPVRAPLAAREFVEYACALDEWLSGQKGFGYAARRNQDLDGRLLLGMRFARDRHAHQATLTAVTAFTLQWEEDADGNRTEPRLYPARFSWRDLVDVSEPNDGRETSAEYRKRRSAYATELAGRPALPTLGTAQRFLIRELGGRGVE